MSYGYFDRLGAGGTTHRAESRRPTEAFADAATVGDPPVRKHILMVAWISRLIGKSLHLDDDSMETLTCGALLHDIGKLSVPHEVLVKRSSLTDEEWQVVRRHPDVGARIIEPVESLSGAVEIIRYHHERYDGTGYPDGLAGEEIPQLARIVTVADSVSAMVLDRPYRRRLPDSLVAEELSRNSGKQFDPVVAGIMLSSLDLLIESGPELMFS